MLRDDLIDATFLRAVDIQRFVTELALGSKAARRRSLTSEAERSALDSEFYREVAGRLNAKRQTAAADLLHRLNLLSDLSAQHAAQCDFAVPRNQTEADVNEMSVEVRRKRGDWAESLQAYEDQKQEYEAFRERRGLRRPAQHRPALFRHVWLLGVILGFEAVMNMVFFASGNAMGFVGGLLIAAFISAANIGVSYCVGWFVTKWAHSIFILKRIAGIVLSLAYVPVLITTHLIVAHYRGEQTLAAEQGQFLTASEYFARALSSFRVNWFDLPDLESWVLLIFGILFGAFAWRKGYQYGDVYPGYTDQFEHLRERREDFEFVEHDLLDILEVVRDRVVKRITGFINQVGPSITMMAQNANAARQLVSRYSAFINSCDQAEALAVDLYVKEAAVTDPSPLTRVSTAPSNEEFELESIVQALEKSAEHTRARSQDVIAEADKYRRDVLLKIDAAGMEFKQPGGKKDVEAAA